jgi:hypothetical protein
VGACEPAGEAASRSGGGESDESQGGGDGCREPEAPATSGRTVQRLLAL